MKTAILILMLAAFCACHREYDKIEVYGLTKTQMVNGVTVLLFPEWKDSQSAFERTVYINYYAFYSNHNWYVREKRADGTLTQFWEDDTPSKSIDDCKSAFGLNIQWNIYKGMYDVLTAPEKKEGEK